MDNLQSKIIIASKNTYNFLTERPVLEEPDWSILSYNPNALHVMRPVRQGESILDMIGFLITCIMVGMYCVYGTGRWQTD